MNQRPEFYVELRLAAFDRRIAIGLCPLSWRKYWNGMERSGFGQFGPITYGYNNASRRA